MSHTDIQLKLVVRPYKRIRKDILANRHQNWISYGSPSWLDERVKSLGEYTQHPILQTRYVMATMKRAAPPSVEDIHGKKVIIILGYSYFSGFEKWVEANNVTLVSAPSHRHALAMLRQGRGDFYLADDVRVRWEVKQGRVLLSDLHLIDFSCLIPPSLLYLLLDKKMPDDIRSQINQALLRLEQQDGIEKIL